MQPNPTPPVPGWVRPRDFVRNLGRGTFGGEPDPDSLFDLLRARVVSGDWPLWFGYHDPAEDRDAIYRICRTGYLPPVFTPSLVRVLEGRQLDFEEADIPMRIISSLLLCLCAAGRAPQPRVVELEYAISSVADLGIAAVPRPLSVGPLAGLMAALCDAYEGSDQLFSAYVLLLVLLLRDPDDRRIPHLARHIGQEADRNCAAPKNPARGYLFEASGRPDRGWVWKTLAFEALLPHRYRDPSLTYLARHLFPEHRQLGPPDLGAPVTPRPAPPRLFLPPEIDPNHRFRRAMRDPGWRKKN